MVNNRTRALETPTETLRGAVYCSRSQVTMRGCTVSSNICDAGGAVVCYSSEVVLNDCSLSYNSGAGIETWPIESSRSRSLVHLDNCTITGNKRSGISSIGAARALGARVEMQQHLLIAGTDGAPTSPAEPIFTGNSGTTMRLFSGIASLCNDPVVYSITVCDIDGFDNQGQFETTVIGPLDYRVIENDTCWHRKTISYGTVQLSEGYHDTSACE